MIPKQLKPEDFCIGSMYDFGPDGRERRCIIGHCMQTGVPTVFRQMLTYACAMCLIDPAQWRKLSPEKAASKAYAARDAIAEELNIPSKQLPRFTARTWPNLCWVKASCNDDQGPVVASKAWNMAVKMFNRHQMGGVA